MSTSTESVVIKKAYTLNKSGKEIRDGWDLFVSGEWHERYRLKRDAKDAALNLTTHTKGTEQ